jgi:hypothetical protein
MAHGTLTYYSMSKYMTSVHCLKPMIQAVRFSKLGARFRASDRSTIPVLIVRIETLF